MAPDISDTFRDGNTFLFLLCVNETIFQEHFFDLDHCFIVFSVAMSSVNITQIDNFTAVRRVESHMILA